MKYPVATMAAAALFLSACAQEKTSSSVMEQTSEECASDAIADRYMVQHLDGRREIVEAPSEKEMRDGYVTRHLASIAYVEHDFRVRADVRPLASDTVTGADNWGTVRINADQLWRAEVKGEDVTVAVVDTGMDLHHPQLANRAWVNPGEQGTDANGLNKASNGVDDDKDGFVDNAVGWDFVKGQPLKGDNQYHGSHVSGIIAAEHQDNVAGAGDHVEGVAPKAKIMPLAFLDAQGGGSMSDGVTAIKYAVDHGARVINASWGGALCSRSLKDVLATLEAKNVAFVGAAGNDGVNVDKQREYPAALNFAAQITVGATGEFDYKADFSNFGVKAVHLYAPGSNIVSTVPGGKMAALSGTSMATPFVTGAVALLVGAEPEATVALVRQALYASAVHRSDYLNASQGRMNLASALAELRRLLGK